LKTISCQTPGEFIFTEQVRPECGPGEALVHMQRLGVCGTDLHAYAGVQPFFTYPRVLGHELAGKIVEVGANAEGLQPGDSVAVMPYLECGRCIACRNGKTNCCTDMNVLGVHSDGGMREYLPVPTDHLIKNEKLSVDQLALVECFAIGAHAVRRAEIQRNENVLVVGAGPIGLGLMQFARIAGGTVTVLDISKERLAFAAKHMDVANTIQAGTVDIKERLNELTDGDFPTVIFDATGNQKSMTDNFLYLAHGGRYVLVSLVMADICFPDPEFHKRETTLLSSRNATRKDFLWVMECMENERIVTDPLITHRSSFENLIDHFQHWTSPAAKVIKAMVEF